MGWQDVIGSILTAGATGDPMAWQRNKLEQAFKRFQMQKATDELEMQREMHGIEKQKLDILLKQKKREEDLDNSPVAGILKVFGITPPEGSEGMTVGQAKQGVPIADMFRKQEKKSSIHTVGGGLYEVPPEGGSAKQLVAPVEKPDKESWIDWGHGQKKNAITGEIAKVPTAPRESSDDKFDKNLLIAAQIAGIDPKKVRGGKLSQAEATKLADTYKEKFGTASLLQALLGGQLGGGQAPTIKYDAKGNQIK
ncbi:MAG: hypothetical protein BWX92_03641 [Deltaproteobacteria bacterium ADurb.Bin135]|nr:MAG: hypothetical protein BWX92_03641 [Deltaproteobacteria bacterium ADurb.Bin135]